MGELKNIQGAVCVLFLCMSLLSCNKTEHIFLINETSQKLTIQAVRNTDSGTQIMDASIEPSGSEGWEFTEGALDKKQVDKYLEKITITNEDGCAIQLDRGDIVKVVKKSGAWALNISSDMMQCD